jgi:molybdopterin converting factor subunit 1
MKIQVLFFGACREAIGQPEIQQELVSPANVAQAFQDLSATFPPLKDFGNSLLFAINEEHSRLDDLLHDGDVLAIFPPVSGG